MESGNERREEPMLLRGVWGRGYPLLPQRCMFAMNFLEEEIVTRRSVVRALEQRKQIERVLKKR